MENESLAFHETMETHEILNLKTIGLMRSKLMQGVCGKHFICKRGHFFRHAYII